MPTFWHFGRLPVQAYRQANEDSAAFPPQNGMETNACALAYVYHYASTSATQDGELLTGRLSRAAITYARRIISPAFGWTPPPTESRPHELTKKLKTREQVAENLCHLVVDGRRTGHLRPPARIGPSLLMMCVLNMRTRQMRV